MQLVFRLLVGLFFLRDRQTDRQTSKRGGGGGSEFLSLLMIIVSKLLSKNRKILDGEQYNYTPSKFFAGTVKA